MKIVFSFCLMFVLSNSFAQTADEYFKKAKDLENTKNYEMALDAINMALAMDSLNIDYYDVKGSCLSKMKDVQGEYNLYSKAISLFPDKSYLYVQEGNVLLSGSQFNDAIAEFSKAVYIAKNDSDKRFALTNRAAAEALKRDFLGAYDDLIASYKLDSNDIAVLINLGAICDDAGKGDETLKYLLRANRLDPKNGGVYANIGFKYQEMGNYKKAIEYYNKVIELDKNEPLGYSNRAYNKLRLKDISGAMDDINKSIQLYGENSYAYRIRALIYIEKKDFEKACKDLLKENC